VASFQLAKLLFVESLAQGGEFVAGIDMDAGRQIALAHPRQALDGSLTGAMARV
jgi:hypothetical protein